MHESPKKGVPDLCSDMKSCNVKRQLQAVACMSHLVSLLILVGKFSNMNKMISNSKVLSRSQLCCGQTRCSFHGISKRRNCKPFLSLFVSEKCCRDHIRIMSEIKQYINTKC